MKIATMSFSHTKHCATNDLFQRRERAMVAFLRFSKLICAELVLVNEEGMILKRHTAVRTPPRRTDANRLRLLAESNAVRQSNRNIVMNVAFNTDSGALPVGKWTMLATGQVKCGMASQSVAATLGGKGNR